MYCGSGSGFAVFESARGEDRATPTGRVDSQAHDVGVTEAPASEVLDYGLRSRPCVDDPYLSSRGMDCVAGSHADTDSYLRHRSRAVGRSGGGLSAASGTAARRLSFPVTRIDARAREDLREGARNPSDRPTRHPLRCRSCVHVEIGRGPGAGRLSHPPRCRSGSPGKEPPQTACPCSHPMQPPSTRLRAVISGAARACEPD